jgi:hypothetical protein
LRGLIAASGLLLALVVAIQFVSGLSAPISQAAQAQAKPGVIKTSRAVEASPSTDTLAANTDVSAPFSGSAVIAPEYIRSDSPPFSSAVEPATIELGANQECDSADDTAPLPPVDDVMVDSSPATQDDWGRLDLRISELERLTATDRIKQEWLPLIERIEAQAQAVHDLDQRLDQVKRQVESFVEPDRETVSPISIRSIDAEGESGWVVHARDANLPEFLARLGETANMNLIVAPEVTGKISLHLRGSDADAVLAAVCKICRCRISRSGNFLVIALAASPVIDPQPTPPDKTNSGPRELFDPPVNSLKPIRSR